MSCSFYTFRQGDFYCTKKSDYVNSDTYYRYCRSYSYDECPIYKHSESTSCYLTTIVCNILGKDDNDLVLNTMRNFRDSVLQNDSKYHDILKYYDAIGPVIAFKMSVDKDRDVLANFLYNSILTPICGFINNSLNDKAIMYYEVMTLSLVNKYDLKRQYNALNFDSGVVDSKKLGHARKLTV